MSWRAALWAVSLGAGLLLTAGCVRRTVTINTDPQGAVVTLNDEVVGTSPVSVDFTWYGDYDVILRKEGYETLKTHYRLDAPWYQIPPIDFVAETLVPVTIHDQHELSFALEPEKPIDREALIKDATTIRDRALYEAP
ncbi:MAG: hypothetical protein AMXMBFR13_46890 [Phycisphaerae bacterium]